MQGLLQEAGVIQPKARRDDKYRSQPRIISRDSTPIRQGASEEKFRSRKSTKKSTTIVPGTKLRLDKKKDKEKIIVLQEDKFTHRSVQTERTDDVNKLYETGVIKYPSPSVLKPKTVTREPSTQQNLAGEGDIILENLQNLG